MSTVKSVLEAINEEYRKVFPESHTYLSQGMGLPNDDEAHCLTLFLGDKEAWYNGIEHNDPFRHQFWIHKPADANGKYVIECAATSMMVECSKDISWTGNTYVKFGWRKKNNTAEKLVPAMKKFFEKMRVIYDERKCEMSEEKQTKYKRF